jgi:uncharacterized protein (TIGR03435 family)
MRRLLWLLAMLAPLSSEAQQTPKFDAIVVRPHDRTDATDGGGVSWRGLAFTATDVPITFLMTQAFGVKKWLIEGLPPWALSAHWDFHAKVSQADVALMQNLDRETRSRMLQTVLTEQFGLRYHFEDKLQPVYELTVLPGGPKFRHTSQDSATHRTGNWSFQKGEVQCENITLGQFANGFSPLVERVVVDRTGLTGKYDLTVQWAPDDAPSADEDTHPGVFTAIREQLGLKLTSSKAPVPVLVIDALTKPEAQ